jgi:hypothetical protein
MIKICRVPVDDYYFAYVKLSDGRIMSSNVYNNFEKFIIELCSNEGFQIRPNNQFLESIWDVMFEINDIKELYEIYPEYLI